MSDYMFLSGRGRITDSVARRVRLIARAHGAEFVHVNLPGDGWRFWFVGPNRGFPFDRALENEVADSLRKKGLLSNDGRIGNFPEGA